MDQAPLLMLLIGLPALGYIVYKILNKSDVRVEPLENPWAGQDELKTLELPIDQTGARLIFGTFRADSKLVLVAPEQRCAAVFAGPRQGKSFVFVGPNVRAWGNTQPQNLVNGMRTQPAVVGSTKTEVIQLCMTPYDRAVVFHPGAGPETRSAIPADIPLVGWNPIDGIREALGQGKTEEQWMEAISAAQQRATDMTSGASAGQLENGSFWLDAAKDVFAALLMAAAIRKNTTMRELMKWASSNANAGEPLRILEHFQKHVGALFDDLNELLDPNTDSRAASNVFFSLRTALGPYKDPYVIANADMPKQNRFRPSWILDPADKRNYRCNRLFVLGSNWKASKLAPLYTGIIGELAQARIDKSEPLLTNRYEVPSEQHMLMMWDEAAHMIKLPDLASLIATGGSQGVVTMLIFQDLNQLIEKYGEHQAKTIVANCELKVFLPGISDSTTNELATNLLGSTVMKMPSSAPPQTGPGKPHDNWSGQEHPIVTAKQFREAEQGTIYAVLGRNTSMKVNAINPFLIPGTYFSQKLEAQRKNRPIPVPDYDAHNRTDHANGILDVAELQQLMQDPYMPADLAAIQLGQPGGPAGPPFLPPTNPNKR